MIPLCYTMAILFMIGLRFWFCDLDSFLIFRDLAEVLKAMYLDGSGRA